jgi:antitoxin (DNA-binding transcriptional repressor) of toxin-antitoxin stability system
MKVMSVGEFKRDFSAALQRVRAGEPIAVSYGRKKAIVAVLAPPAEGYRKGTRKLGRYAGQVRVRFAGHWQLDESEWVNS